MSETQKVFGIDLGTTYSAIAHIDEHGMPVVIKNSLDDNAAVMPSVVLVEEGGNVVVGDQAKKEAVTAPDRVFEEIKRSMGDPNYYPKEIDGVDYKPEVVSSLILQKLAKYASESLGVSVKDVVITVPAYFGEGQREATRISGRLAGLNVLHILNEPTAAALCYGMDKVDQDQTVLVYDLGGGTFDITMIQVKSKSIEVVVTGGDHDLGGKRWDEAVIKYVADQFEAEHGVNPLDDPEATQDLRLRCEDAKKALTNKQSAKISVSFGKRSTVELTRERFDELTAHLLDNSISLTRDLIELARNEKGVTQIDMILLVGGSSRMPQVAEALRREFTIEPKLYDPDEAVAKGAAIMGLKVLVGDKLDEEIKKVAGEDATADTVSGAELEEVYNKIADHLSLAPAFVRGAAEKTITNVNSHSIGVVVTSNLTGDEEVAVLIAAQATLPAQSSQQFGTLAENQQNVNIRVVQGESRLPSECNQLNEDGNLLELPSNLPQGSPIEITFEMDEQGTLHVVAEDLVGHRKTDFAIQRVGVMTQEEELAAQQAVTGIMVQ